jgi:hypothetical protein
MKDSKLHQYYANQWRETVKEALKQSKKKMENFQKQLLKTENNIELYRIPLRNDRTFISKNQGKSQ